MMKMKMMSRPRSLPPRKPKPSLPPRRRRRRLNPLSPRLLKSRRKPPRRKLPRRLRNERQMIDSHLYRKQISNNYSLFPFQSAVSVKRFAEFNKIYKLSHFQYRKDKPPYYISWNRTMQSIHETQTQQASREFFNMFQNEKTDNLFLRSISKELDQYFGGGLHKGTITQIYGESGCGKSQLAMLFALGAVSRNIPCCYLSTEKEMSWNRYTSIAYKYMNEAQFQQTERALMYKKSSDFNQGYPFIEQCLKRMKQTEKGGLLIIDSVHCFIMSCLQFHNIENDAFQKSRKQAQIVNRLRWIAKMAGCAVLFINHAADLMDKRRSSFGRSVVASLGPAWQLNIDQNIYMSRKGEIRSMSIIHSPKCASNKKMRFRIENDGFVWISQDGVEYVE